MDPLTPLDTLCRIILRAKEYEAQVPSDYDAGEDAENIDGEDGEALSVLDDDVNDGVEEELRAAIDDPDPVVFMEPKRLYWSKDDVDLEDLASGGGLPPGTACVRREGADVTLVAYGPSVPVAMEAAEAAAEEGWSCEVVDLRTIDPYDDETVVAPFYPKKKLANWWVVVGEPKTKQLLAIKKVTVHRNLNVRLEFSLPQGQHALKLYVICDSYMGADHDIDVDPIDVAEGEESESEEESDEDAMEE